jgi:hypothetical protein
MADLLSPPRFSSAVLASSAILADELTDSRSRAFR